MVKKLKCCLFSLIFSFVMRKKPAKKKVLEKISIDKRFKKKRNPACKKSTKKAK